MAYNWIGGPLSGIGAGLMAAGAGGWQQFAPAMAVGQQQYDQQQQAQQAQKLQELNAQIAQQRLEDDRLANTQAAEAQKRWNDMLSGMGPGLMAPGAAAGPGDQSAQLAPGLMQGGAPQIPPFALEMARAAGPEKGPSILAPFLKPQDAPNSPASVQEYEYAKGQGFNGSLLDYERQKAEAGRAPAQPNEPPADIQEYQFAKGQGFTGTYMDWVASKRGGGIQVDTNGDGSPDIVVGGAGMKPQPAANQQSNLRASMIEDAIKEFDTINFDNVRTPRIVAAEKTADSPVFNAVIQKGLNEDEKKLLSNQGKIQEATISAITGAAYSSEQKNNMRAAYVPLATDDAETRIRKLKDAAKFLRQLNANTGRLPENALPEAPKAADQPPMEGAKKAPDGNWYVPDPARPGKYLKVD